MWIRRNTKADAEVLIDFWKTESIAALCVRFSVFWQ